MVLSFYLLICLPILLRWAPSFTYPNESPVYLGIALIWKWCLQLQSSIFKTWRDVQIIVIWFLDGWLPIRTLIISFPFQQGKARNAVSQVAIAPSFCAFPFSLDLIWEIITWSPDLASNPVKVRFASTGKKNSA